MLRMRLRTKFLVSMLVISSGLTCISLLLVRSSVETHTRKEIFADLHNSISTFQNFQWDREETLAHSAELVANLPIVRALMTTQHVPTIQDASRDLWQLAGSDLFVLSDRSGKVVALHSKNPGFGHHDAEECFRNDLNHSDQLGRWWFGAHQLYEVFLMPIYFGAASENNLLGFVAVGYEIDVRVLQQISGIAAGQVAFRYGDAIVRSTLPSEQQAELSRLTHSLSAGASPNEITLGKERFLATSVELASGRSPVSLIALKSYDQATKFLDDLNRLLLGLGLVAVLGGSFLVFLISHTFTRPLGELVSGVRALENGDASYPLRVRGRDEVAEVTAAFDEMRRTLQKDRQDLLDAERLATIGRMASSISHDLRHSLAAIVANAEFLSDTGLTAEQREDLYREVRIAENRMTDLIDSLLEFSWTREALRPCLADASESVRKAVEVIRTHPEFHEVVISVSAEPPTCGWFDPRKLERVLYNLLLNACEAVPRGSGRVHVELLRNSDHLEIRIADNGPGVSVSIRQHLFEPFVTCGKESGSGLGLAVAQKIVQDHGGEIAVEQSSEAGTTFRISIPLHCEASFRPTGEQAAGPLAAGRKPAAM